MIQSLATFLTYKRVHFVIPRVNPLLYPSAQSPLRLLIRAGGGKMRAHVPKAQRFKRRGSRGLRPCNTKGTREVWQTDKTDRQINFPRNIHRVSKNSQSCFWHNFVKLPPPLIIFGTKMAKTILFVLDGSPLQPASSIRQRVQRGLIILRY